MTVARGTYGTSMGLARTGHRYKPTLKQLARIEPLFKPPFGPPIRGRLCEKCSLWFPTSCFRNKGGCARCRLKAKEK